MTRASRLKSGRVEKRTATVCHDVDWLRERHDWPGLSAFGKVVAERRLADGSESIDTRYYLLSAKPSAERFGRTVRSHWAIENSLHWVLDVSMDEDQARNRKGNSAACLAVVRRLALNIARMHPDKRSIRRKFTRAQRDDDFLLDMIRRVRSASRRGIPNAIALGQLFEQATPPSRQRGVGVDLIGGLGG